MGTEVEVALKELAGQGLLGVLLFLSFIVIWKLAKYVQDIQEKRIAEGLANQRVLTELTQAVKDLSYGVRERGVK